MTVGRSILVDVPADKVSKAALNDDPWTVIAPPDSGKPWKEKNSTERFLTLLSGVVKGCALLGLLYLFICSLDFLSSAFRLLGGKAAGEAFRQNTILSNPIADLMIGVLATVLLQSSSTTTSIIVTMVAADILTVRPAIFLVMGANIGTSVTNTIVSMGHATERSEFRRAFAGATVHDMFNWLSVLCFLPIEWISGSFGTWKDCGILCQFTGWIVEDLKHEGNAATQKELLKVITKPFTSLVMQLDKSVLTKYVTMNSTQLAKFNQSLVKHSCKVIDPHYPVAVSNNVTGQCEIQFIEKEVKQTCKFMFEHIANSWSDTQVGIALLALSLFILCLCLFLIVKLLHSILKGKIAVVLKKFVNSDFPGKYTKHLTGYLAILLGAGFTMLVQSSSIFTSALTPLVGVGVLHLERMYPLTLGANIGTTFTAILAALASDGDKLGITLQVALCHLFFNIFGILVWYPIPYMRNIPIAGAKLLGNTTAKYRWFAIVYLIIMFFALPAAVFGLSVANEDGYVLLGVGLPILIAIVVICVINKLQTSRPQSLPEKLRNWDFLPKGLHSLEPYDRVFIWIRSKCCCCCKEKREPEDQQNSQESSEMEEQTSTLKKSPSTSPLTPELNNRPSSNHTAHVNHNGGACNDAFTAIPIEEADNGHAHSERL